MSEWSPVDALGEIRKGSEGFGNYRNDSWQVRKGGMVSCLQHCKSLYAVTPQLRSYDL